MKIRISLIFIALAFLFVSCGSSLSEEGNGYVSVDLSEVVQSISSRAAGDNKNVNVNLWTEGDFETSLTASLSASGKEEIIIKNIPLNSSISINIEASSGKKNYLGASDKIIVKEGNNPVTITLNKTVPTTDIVLYNRSTERSSYYLANSAGTNLDSPELFFQPDYGSADFAFDADGNIYLSTMADTLSFFYYNGVSKSNNGRIRIIKSENEVEQITEGKLKYDFAKNQMWVLKKGEFYKLAALRQSETADFDYQTSATIYNSRTTETGAGEYLYASCIYNDIVYMVFEHDNSHPSVPFFLLQYDISKAVVDDEDVTQFSLGLPDKVIPLCEEMNLSNSAGIKDMLYQDGALYLLLNDAITRYTSVSSCGAILKYDIKEEKVTKVAGLATETILSEFDAGCWANGKGLVYNSEDENDYYIAHFTDPYTIKAPYKDSINSYFAGPDRFIALKPKKLVISDNGIALYTNAITGALTKKKVNRVIEVDLASLSIEKATKTDVVQEFNTNYEDASTSGITITGNFQTNNAYYRNPNNPSGTVGTLNEDNVELKATILDE